jgi:hypothetical protein
MIDPIVEIVIIVVFSIALLLLIIGEIIYSRGANVEIPDTPPPPPRRPSKRYHGVEIELTIEELENVHTEEEFNALLLKKLYEKINEQNKKL